MGQHTAGLPISEGHFVISSIWSFHWFMKTLGKFIIFVRTGLKMDILFQEGRRGHQRCDVPSSQKP